jgi:O-antigen/teichoic acid export membrane protein
MLSQPLGFVSSAFNVSAFPSLARTASRGAETIRPMLRRAVKFQFLAGLPLSVGLFILAPRVVPLLLKGEDFRVAGTTLRVIGAGLVLIFLNLMARYVLTALDSQRAYFRAIVAGLGANAVVSVALIPRFGAAGACVGLLAGELTVLILCQRVLARWMPAADVFRELVRPLAAALIMGAAVVALRHAPLNVAPVVGGIVYVVAVIALKALSPDEMRMLRGVYVSFRLPGSGRMIRAANRS